MICYGVSHEMLASIYSQEPTAIPTLTAPEDPPPDLPPGSDLPRRATMDDLLGGRDYPFSESIRFALSLTSNIRTPTSYLVLTQFLYALTM